MGLRIKNFGNKTKKIKSNKQNKSKFKKQQSDDSKKTKNPKQKIKTEILNSRERKEIFNLIDSSWGTNSKEILDSFLFVKTQKDKIYFLTKDFLDFDYNKLFNLRLNSFGIYFGRVEKNRIRLTIEGSQLIGNKATKNVLILNEKQIELWIKGEDLFFDSLEETKEGSEFELFSENFIIIKNQKDDIIGCGKISTKSIQGKERYVLNNYIPKSRRISNIA